MAQQYNFFAMVNRMKMIDRWALMQNTSKENIAEHSHSVAVIAHALALIGNKYYGKNYDENRAAVLALYHDTTEVITGDMPTPVKYYNDEIKSVYKDIEDVAGKRLIAMLPDDFKADYEPFFTHNEEDKPLWKLVKAADKISALIKCIEETGWATRNSKLPSNRRRKKLPTLICLKLSIFASIFEGVLSYA